jgi:riboflavin synthase
MFTGLVEEIGRIRSAARSAGGLTLEIDASFAAELRAGDSVAVSGVCLTAGGGGDGYFRADVVPETARRTYLDRLRPGDLVNLERALRAGDRMGGHIVQGHVDGLGSIVSLRAEGDGKRIAVRVPGEALPYLVFKGSLAIDGVSLTIAAVEGGIVEAALVPWTLARTTLGRARRGGLVHVEADVLARYAARREGRRGRSAEWFRENGYA